jgi:hypothetical protein
MTGKEEKAAEYWRRSQLHIEAEWIEPWEIRWVESRNFIE